MHLLLNLIYAYRMIGVWEILISSSSFFFNITILKHHAEVEIVTRECSFLSVCIMLKNSCGKVIAVKA